MDARMKRNSEHRRVESDGDVLKGLAAGIVGGLVASFVMNQFQALWSKLAEGEERSHGAQSMQQGSPEQGVGRKLQEAGKDEPDDDAPERLANAIAVGVFDHELTKPEKDAGATALHYAMGTTSGALYGALAEFVPEVKVGAGLPFGAFIWLAVDEGLMPATGLSKSATEYPLSIHAYALSSHLVYGLTTELVRRVVRDAL
jgi:putative membrane protein